MKYEDKQTILGKLDYEGGYEYLVNGYDFRNYGDVEFNRLVMDFQRASKALDDFLGEMGESE